MMAIAVQALTGLQYLSLLVTAGLLLCRVTVARGRDAAQALGSVAAVRRTRVLASAAALTSVALMVAAAIDVAGWSRWTAGIIPQQLAAAVLVGTGSLIVVVAGGARRPVPTLAGALLGLLGPALTGHSVSVGPRPLMLVVDVGHLLAGAFWTGGLIGTVAVIAALRSDGTAEEAVVVIRRFSSAALVSVLVLAVSGGLMTVLILDAPAALVTAGWGRALLLKLSVVGVAVGLAAWNRTRLLPAIATADAPWERLLRIMRREAVLLLGVLVVTGVLVNLSPHESPPGGALGNGQSPVGAQETMPIAASEVGGPGEPGAPRMAP